MYFIVVIVNAKCVQADQKDTFITIAMRYSTGMRENAVINLFQKINFRKSSVPS